MWSIITEFDDGVGFSIMQGLGVLGLKHFDDSLYLRNKRASLILLIIFPIIEELINRLDASLLHIFTLIVLGLCAT